MFEDVLDAARATDAGKGVEIKRFWIGAYRGRITSGREYDSTRVKVPEDAVRINGGRWWWAAGEVDNEGMSRKSEVSWFDYSPEEGRDTGVKDCFLLTSRL